MKCSNCNNEQPIFREDGKMVACMDHDAQDELCPHGMSLWLCAHPTNHYPTREMEQRGEYF